MIKKDLKIQFRAVKYATIRALEYRIDPDDDNNNFIATKSYLFGLIKRKVKKSYSCDWKTIRYFAGYLDYEDKAHELQYQPFWIRNQKDLDWYKERFKTYGEFMKYVYEIEEKNYERYKKNRQAYLDKTKTIY